MGDGISIVPADQAGWPAVEEVMMSEATSRNCWCQFHVLENRVANTTTRESRKSLLQEQVTTLDPPRGLIALEDEQPVGWCGVEPRTRLNHILATRLVTGNTIFALDDPGVWVVYCILVPPAHRRKGVGARLLREAVAHASEHGAAAIEGLPIDTSMRGGKLPPGFSTGTLAMYIKEGFTPVAALPSGRTLVYKTF